MGTCDSHWMFCRNGSHALPVDLRPIRRDLHSTGRAIPTILGIVLLVAAALKIHQIMTHTSPESGILDSRWLRIGLIEVELALGLGLLFQICPQQMRIAALICFTAFATASLQQALVGKPSCTCFGSLSMRPWYAFAFDIAALAALAHWRPKGCLFYDPWGTGKGARYSKPLLWIPCAIWFLPACLFIFRPFFLPSYPSLVVTPQTINMGKVQAGSSKRLPFTVTNAGAAPVSLGNITTTCECLKVDVTSGIIAPGQTVAGSATIDLATEQAFEGTLGIQATCLSRNGGTLFSLLVNVDVNG